MLLIALTMTQGNAVMSHNGELTSLGISTQEWWLMMNPQIGIDFEFNPAEVIGGRWPEASGLSIDLDKMTIALQSQNAELHAELMPGSDVRLEIILTDR